MDNDLLILGAGGHARSVLDILLQNGEYRVVGCLSPQYPEQQTVPEFSEVPIIGTDEDLPRWLKKGVRKVFIALGKNELRHKLFLRSVALGFEPVNAIAKSAVISPRAKLGSGICVMPGAIVNVNVQIADNCIINTNCGIDHDCSIGMSAHIAPGCALSGCVCVGEGTQIGTGASVIDGIKIGAWSMIGAGSTVVRDIGDHSVAYGVPARVVRNKE